MNLSYRLSGTFVEACNCAVICPCWLEDDPTEDFCAGLFAWTFAPGSTIEAHDVSGHALVSVSVHGDSRRGGASESAIFVDRHLDREAVELLVQAFSGRAGGPLADLASVTGDVVLHGPADVAVRRSDEAYVISVTSDGTQLVHVSGHEKRYDANAEPMRLTASALHHELGIGSEPVTVHVSDELRIDVAALPGPALDVVARSGMTGNFTYVANGRDDDDGS